MGHFTISRQISVDKQPVTYIVYLLCRGYFGHASLLPTCQMFWQYSEVYRIQEILVVYTHFGSLVFSLI